MDTITKRKMMWNAKKRPTVREKVVPYFVVPPADDKNISHYREMLMERIRLHSSRRTYQELSKAARMSYIERRYSLEPLEKSNLQKSLDRMSHCIRATSRQGLVERLEALSRQLGLKFMDDSSGLFISTDMFFLEIHADPNGVVSDVKVHHECKIEQQSCSELVSCLNRGDFKDFTVQLEGLCSIYQLNAEPKIKTKAFVALQSMEMDFCNIFKKQQCSKDIQKAILESPVGLVMKRRGGHPLKLVYFVSPSDLISLSSETNMPSFDLVNALVKEGLGFTVTVHLQASSANKLQILPTVTFQADPKLGGVEVIKYEPLNQQNSMLLPATFVLRLNKSIPVCSVSLQALELELNVSSSAPTSATTSGTEPSAQFIDSVGGLVELMLRTECNETKKPNQKGLVVNMPDQIQCYYFTENYHFKATVVSNFVFTEPSQVVGIMSFLRKQAVFYTLLSSCVRSQGNAGNIDLDHSAVVEVNVLSFTRITVTLQHPYEDVLAKIDFELCECNVKCTVVSSNQNYVDISHKLNVIAQASLSIPLTIRALVAYWEYERTKKDNGNGGVAQFDTKSANISTNAPTVGIFPKTEPPDFREQTPTAVRAGNNAMKELASEIKPHKNVDKEEIAKNRTAVAAPTTTANQSPQTTSGQPSLAVPQKQQPMQHMDIIDKYTNIWKEKTASLKNSVSITPVNTADSSDASSQQQAMDVQLSGGIEIIPLIPQAASVAAKSSTTAMSSSNSEPPAIPAVATSSAITITPINVNNGGKEKKIAEVSESHTSSTGGSGGGGGGGGGGYSSTFGGSSSSKRTFDASTMNLALDGQKEKKRKKKRDDSPMGPPDKIYSRQNSPVTIGTDGGHARKFSSSSSPKALNGSQSMISNTSMPMRPSPKHTPSYSSPKHSTSSNSPTSPFGTHSPKHGSSGKPSMSTLKNVSGGPSSVNPKSDKLNLVGSGAGSNAAGGPLSSSSATSTPSSNRSFPSVSSSNAIVNPSCQPVLNNAMSGGFNQKFRNERNEKVNYVSSSPSTSSAAVGLAGAANVASTSAAHKSHSVQGALAMQQHMQSMGSVPPQLLKSSTETTLSAESSAVELNTQLFKKMVDDNYGSNSKGEDQSSAAQKDT